MAANRTSHCDPASVRLGIVCPMANERETATEFVCAVLDHCRGVKVITFFAILDNASTAGTLDALEELAQKETRLVVVWAPENQCLVDAYVRGYREALDAGCDWILEIDGGFGHQPADIPQFLETMRQGYDCVFGSRFCAAGTITNMSLRRYIVSRGGSMLANLLLGTTLTDMTSGFELFSRPALESVLRKGIQSRGHFFQTEIKVHCRNMHVAEVPINYRVTSDKLPKGTVDDALHHLWRLFRQRLAGNM